MSARDGAAAEGRARLQALAFGPGVPPDVAARARDELAALDARPVRGSSSREGSSTGGGSGHASLQQDDLEAPAPLPDTGGEPRAAAEDAHGDSVGADDEATGAVGEDAPPVLPHPPALAGRRAIRTAVAAVGIAAVVAAAFLGGMTSASLTGGGPAQNATSAASDAADASGDGPPDTTIGELLDAPQTYADQLPGAISAPVDLATTRLIFSNRSLEADDAETPWDVYAGVGDDKSLVCIIATPNHLTATEACYPRSAVLTGDVSLVAEEENEVLTVTLHAGNVDGVVDAVMH